MQYKNGQHISTYNLSYKNKAKIFRIWLKPPCAGVSILSQSLDRTEQAVEAAQYWVPTYTPAMNT